MIPTPPTKPAANDVQNVTSIPKVSLDALTPEERIQIRFANAVNAFTESTGLLFAEQQPERDYQLRVNEDPDLPGKKKKVRYKGMWVLFVEPYPEDVEEPTASAPLKKEKKPKKAKKPIK